MIKTLILSLSFFGMGVTAYLGAMNLRNALKLDDKKEKRLEASYAMARFGLVIVMGLISEAIFGAPALELTWRVVLYAVGVGLVLFGYLGIAVTGKQIKRGFTRYPGDV